jgi:uncharacterized protein DUF4338
VSAKRNSLLWNAYIQRYHYLGHQPIPGAQLRYFVRAAGQIIALLPFGASAWKTKSRDEFIGWSHEQCPHKLHLVVGVNVTESDRQQVSTTSIGNAPTQADSCGVGRICVRGCQSQYLASDGTCRCTRCCYEGLT